MTNSYSSSTTFTVPSGVSSILVECWGGGGGGGGAKSPTTGGYYAAAGGGGGGAYSKGTITVTAGNVFTVTVGGGGAGGASTGTNGVTGGTTSFSGTPGTVSAVGGNGGIGALSTTSASVFTAGGSGGSSGVGFLYAGGNGATGVTTYYSGGGGGGAGSGGNGTNGAAGSTGSSSAASGGTGTTPGGIGGYGNYVYGGGNGDGANLPTVPGGGGGGGVAANGTSFNAYAGGSGAAGLVKVTYTIVSCTAPTISSLSSANPTGCGGTNGQIQINTSGTVTDYSKDNGSTWVASAGNTYTFTTLSAGTYTIKVRNTSSCVTTYTSNPVTLSGSSIPAAPNAITSNSPQCAGTGVTFTQGTCTSGSTCYWVSSATGTEITNSTSTYTSATTTGTYTVWVRAKDNTSGCWSSAVTATGTVNSTISAPTNVTATSPICLGSSTALNATSAGNTINWYDASSGGNFLGTSASGVNFNYTPPVASTYTYYAATAELISGSQTFNYSGAITTWTVPAGVTSINIDARGAQGGTQPQFNYGGKGARIVGNITVTPGQILKILVGQQGIAGASDDGAGGGGGTFITDNSNNPLIVAGGGGGDGADCSGIDASITSTTPNNCYGESSHTGTTGGTGWDGGGGGGLTGNGGNGANGSTNAGGGKSFTNGGAGGIGLHNGGFGGGGAGSTDTEGAGGGGGYGGGAGGDNYLGSYDAGAGGSSFCSVSPTTAVATQTGNGQVVITWSSLSGCESTRIPTSVVVVNPSPTITGQPASSTILQGASTTFTVSTSTLSSTYQWQYSADGSTAWASVANATPTGISYTGATTATLSVATASTVALGTYYYRCVISAGGCTSNSTSASLIIGIAGDNCSNATTLTISSICSPVVANIVSSHTKYGTPLPSCFNYNEKDIWFKFNGNGSLVTVKYTPVSEDAVMVIYTGNCTSLTEYECSNVNSYGAPEVSIIENSDPNTTYYVRILNYWSGTMDGTICVWGGVESNGNTCSTAPIISSILYSSNLSASAPTSISPEGNAAGNQFTCVSSVDRVTYYKIYATGGTVTATFEELNCWYNNGIQVGLFLPSVACNSSVNWNSSVYCTNQLFANTTNTLSWSGLQANQTYYIIIDAYSTAANGIDRCSWRLSLSGALPVELTEFTAACQNQQVKLNWTTQSELNNDYFIVERSKDGILFNEIGRVTGHGTSNAAHHYQYFDEQSLSGTAYYRLNQFDYNGESKLHPIVMSKCYTSKNEIIIYPNPNNGTFEISGLAIDADIDVVDVLGKKVFSTQSKTVKEKLQLTGIKPGVYFVVIKNASGEINTQKILIEL